MNCLADELLGLRERKSATGGGNRRMLPLLQQIELLPKRDQEALLRTIDAFLSKTRTALELALAMIGKATALDVESVESLTRERALPEELRGWAGVQNAEVV